MLTPLLVVITANVIKINRYACDEAGCTGFIG